MKKVGINGYIIIYIIQLENLILDIKNELFSYILMFIIKVFVS